MLILIIPVNLAQPTVFGLNPHELGLKRPTTQKAHKAIRLKGNKSPMG